MRTALLFFFLLTSALALSQRQKEFSLALTNNNTAFPFSKFGSLFTTAFHPGVEAGYNFNWKTAPRHDWFQTVKAGYFFHRFVQHAVPIYTQFGYKYKWGEHLRLSGALGAGYLHSVPATAVLEQDEGGNYENGKGIGRSQVLFNVAFGVHYGWALKSGKRITPFFTYQQQIQAPFVRSYVPLLPYSNVALGVSYPFTRK
jgi:hypothetical protein